MYNVKVLQKHFLTVFWYVSGHLIIIVYIHRKSKKTRHQTLGHNFTNYYPIFKIFSLADSVVNLQQTRVYIFHHALNMLLHYLVKYECQKNGIILKYVLQLMMNHKVV